MTAQAATQLATILRTNHQKLFNRALQLAGNTADAHDLLQDTLERAARMFHTYTPGTNSGSWMVTIMTRIFIDQWRRRRKHGVSVPLDMVELVAPEEEGEEPAWCSLTVDDVQRALDVLPLEWRRLFERQAFSDTPYAELAQDFGLPLATVGTRLHRARMRLRRELQTTFEARRSAALALIASSPSKPASAPAPRARARRASARYAPMSAAC